MDTFAYDHGLPCKNPNCRSHGMPHPNCRCYSGGGEDTGHMAKGGEVHFCSKGMPHQPGCEYFADGGTIQEDPSMALGHAGVHHGLSGMLKSIGHSKLAEPDRHLKTIYKLKDHLAAGEHDKATDLMHEHPMSGGMGKTNLKDSIARLHKPLMQNDANPDALRSSMDYLNSAAKGHEALKSHSNSLFGDKKSQPVEPEEALRETLKSHLDELQMNPEKMLDVGGSLAHYMPEHATQLSAALATSVDYLNSIKPKPVQMGSLDVVIKPDKAAEASYHRQLDIAEQPLLVLQHTKDGTLLPQDLQTLQTIYPGLHKSMVSKAGEALIEAKSKNKPIPYRQRQTMSMLLNEPLDFTQTPGAMQAIIKANAGSQQAQQSQGQPKKATNVELKQINKTDALAQTPLEARQIDNKT